MNLEINHVSKRLVEVSVDALNTGLLNSKEAQELALHLLQVAAELIEVEQGE